MVADILEALCIRSTSLKFAFREIDKFYVLNGQEASTVDTFLSATTLNCRQTSPIQRLAQNKVVQLTSALTSTEEIVSRMIQILKGEKSISDASNNVDQDVIVDLVSTKLASSFLERLKRNRLLDCPFADLDGARTTASPRQLFSTFSSSILTTQTLKKELPTPAPIIVRTDDIRHNLTETKTSITVAENKTAEAQTSIFVREQSPEKETDATFVQSSTSNVDGIETSTATTLTPTTTTTRTTTAAGRTSEQGFEPVTTLFPIRDVEFTMTPRSTRPTGTTTTVATTTTGSSSTSGRINPSLLNLLGRG